MKCPSCGNTMTEITAGSIKVNACSGGCGGLWFDEWELRNVDQADQSAGEALLHIPRDPAVEVDPNQRRKCPKNADVVLMRHFWSPNRQVTVDECPECEGVFLDPGELAKIRDLYHSDDERHQAAHEYYNEMFDDQLAGMLKEDEAKLEKARRFSHMFRFVCPSYYMPGKQRWGAF